MTVLFQFELSRNTKLVGDRRGLARYDVISSLTTSQLVVDSSQHSQLVDCVAVVDAAAAAAVSASARLHVVCNAITVFFTSTYTV